GLTRSIKGQSMVKRCWQGMASVVVAAVLLPPAEAGKAGGPIVPPDARLEKVFDGGVVLTEGVAVAPDGMVYFSDITFTHVSRDKTGAIEAGHIWKFNPKTGKARLLRSPTGIWKGEQVTATGT